MVEAQETNVQPASTNLWWWLAVAYGALAALWWLWLGSSRFFQWRRYTAAVAAEVARGNLEFADQVRGFSGSLIVDFGFAYATAAVFMFVVFALMRRSWNAWDYATVATGFVTVFSLIFLCARTRIMFFIPLTSAPLLGLLYLPGTKAACNVGEKDEAQPELAPAALLERDEIEREIAKERNLITQLSQNLDVFEIERNMDTDTFVARYTEGLEEESADNAEWFSIARAVRRSRERISALMVQLNAVSERRQKS